MQTRLLILLPLALVISCGGGGGADESASLPSEPVQGAPIDAPLAVAVPAPPVDQPTPAEPVPEEDPPPAAPPSRAHANPGHGVTAAKPAVDELEGGVTFLTFDDVAFPEYEPPELREVEDEILPLDEFPEAVQALTGKQVVLDGYMVPVDFEDRKVTSFILSRYLPGCCFGMMPMMDEWVEVEVLDEEGVDYFPFQIVRVEGEFDVGEVLDDYGYVRSIYRIRGETVAEQQ